MNSKPDSGVCWPARGSECSKGASLWALGWPTYWSVVHDLGSRVAQCWGLPPLMPPVCGLWAVSGLHLGALVLDASPAPGFWAVSGLHLVVLVLDASPAPRGGGGDWHLVM